MYLDIMKYVGFLVHISTAFLCFHTIGLQNKFCQLSWNIETFAFTFYGSRDFIEVRLQASLLLCWYTYRTISSSTSKSSLPQHRIQRGRLNHVQQQQEYFCIQIHRGFNPSGHLPNIYVFLGTRVYIVGQNILDYYKKIFMYYQNPDFIFQF